MSVSNPRIAVFYNNPFGGSGRVVYEMTHRLAQRYDVRSFTMRPPGLGLEVLEALKPERPVIYRGFPSIPRPFGRLHSVTSLIELWRLNRAYRILAEQINGAFDLAIVHQCPYTSAPFLLRHLTVPSILWTGEPLRGIHEPKVARPSSDRLLGRHAELVDNLDPFLALQHRILGSVDRSNARRASAVMTYSYYSREVLYRVYGINASVNYLGVDTDVFVPLPIDKQHMVLSLGHITPLKGHDFVIQAIGNLPSEIRPQLVIAGNIVQGAESDYLKTLAYQQGVRLAFESSDDDRQIVERYNRAKILVFAPILEPFGLAPLEAMACGVPVVGVREAGVRETVREGGYLVDRDIDAFSEKLALLLSNDNLRQQLGVRGREYVIQEWSWSSFMQRLETRMSATAAGLLW